MLVPAQRQRFHHGFEHDVGVLALGTRMRIASLMVDRRPSRRVTGACNAPHRLCHDLNGVRRRPPALPVVR